jgi:hypothetical protein
MPTTGAGLLDVAESRACMECSTQETIAEMLAPIRGRIEACLWMTAWDGDQRPATETSGKSKDALSPLMSGGNGE